MFRGERTEFLTLLDRQVLVRLERVPNFTDQSSNHIVLALTAHLSLQCNYESAREDHFLDIPLVIKPFGSTTAYGSMVRINVYFTTQLEGEPTYRIGDHWVCGFNISVHSPRWVGSHI